MCAGIVPETAPVWIHDCKMIRRKQWDGILLSRYLASFYWSEAQWVQRLR